MKKNLDNSGRRETVSSENVALMVRFKFNVEIIVAKPCLPIAPKKSTPFRSGLCHSQCRFSLQGKFSYVTTPLVGIITSLFYCDGLLFHVGFV